MTNLLRFLPELQEDAFTGYVWYEAKATGLGEDFLQMFYTYTGEISKNPFLYPKVHGEIRRCLLRRFPYALYFRIEGNEITVLGLFHCARDPRTIIAEMRERETPNNS